MTDAMSAQPEPIMIRCEGSRCPTHDHGHALGYCAMCGRLVVTEDDGIAYVHQREDLLAELARGDYG